MPQLLVVPEAHEQLHALFGGELLIDETLHEKFRVQSYVYPSG